MTSSPSAPPASVATEVSFRPLAFAGATVAFLVIGATSSLFGPLLVPFAHRFHLSLASAGTVLSVFFVGALFGVLLAWLGVKHLHGASVLAIDLGLMAVGSTGIALSNNWALFLACVAFMGLGFGGPRLLAQHAPGAHRNPGPRTAAQHGQRRSTRSFPVAAPSTPSSRAARTLEP